MSCLVAMVFPRQLGLRNHPEEGEMKVGSNSESIQGQCLRMS